MAASTVYVQDIYEDLVEFNLDPGKLGGFDISADGVDMGPPPGLAEDIVKTQLFLEFSNLKTK
jgi:hypothetical protein